jgi:hypothetical protein
MTNSDERAKVFFACVCPVHGLISDREMEDAPCLKTDYWGEPCEPYGCPVHVGKPVPTTEDRTRLQGFEGGLLTRWPRTFDDPGWVSIECMQELDELALVPR